MQKHHSIPLALLCISFHLGCGASAQGNSTDSTEPSGNPYSAPIGTPDAGSSSSSAPTDDGTGPTQSDGTADSGSTNTHADAGTDPPSSPTTPDAGPPPTETCTVTKDSDGFFTRTSAKSDYVAYVPASYSSSTPMRVIVGLHGCGDSAANFATWGVNPYPTRAKQTHIGISVSGETGSGGCWNKGGDDDKVMAAVDDIAKCFWVDRSRVIIAGFSSGGELAYRVGMMQASSFAGILIENSSISSSGSTVSALLAGASWKLPIAHRAHQDDTVFPIDTVQADWAQIQKAGFPLTTSVVAGTHDGTSDDWANWIIPQSATWVKD